MDNSGICRKALMALTMALLYFVLSSPCAAEQHDAAAKTVRVAYFDLEDYYKKNTDGSIHSYDAAYLSMIAEYTDLHFEYVDCGTWDRALQMLKNHEVDLVGTMQWTQEREDQYEVCDASYGYTVAELAALGTSRFAYEDYDQLSGASVGFVSGYVIAEQLHTLMKKRNITLTLRPYPNQQALTKALESGEIDLIAANAQAIRDEWKIISKFYYAPFYFASWKGNEKLIESLSDAIIRIHLHQDDFDDKLAKEYFSRMINTPYSKAEMNCVAEGKAYTIYLDDNTRPLSWYDKATGQMRGILPTLIDTLMSSSGLKLDILPKASQPQGNPATTVDYYIYQKGFNTSADKQTGRSKSICDNAFLFYHKSRHSYSLNSAQRYRVALVKNREGCKRYLEEQYPHYTLVEYTTPQECISRLVAGDVDLAFLSSYAANHIIVAEDLSEVTGIPTSAVTFGIGLQFYGDKAELLANITDKGRHLISYDTFKDIILEHVTNTMPDATLLYLVRHNLTAATLGIGTFFVLALLSVSLLFYVRFIRAKSRQIEATDQAHMEFFSRMSHDMRTPMNGILGMIELTEQANDFQEVKSNMAKAKSSGIYMLSLINDTLDLRCLENGGLHFVPQCVPVKAFLENLQGMVTPSAEQKNITLTWQTMDVDLMGYIKLDPVRVKQIFVNLLSNALKFTPEGGKIEVTIECLSRKGAFSHTKITVHDTGIGMSKDFIKNNLYKPYSQERNSMAGQHAGSGLGLAITKNLVAMMGGHIEVRSTLGKGTTFFVYLDFEHVEEKEGLRGQSQKDSKRTAPHMALLGAHILVCEDHPLNAEITKRLLEKAHCEVSLARNGQEGVNCFKASEVGYFDAILMDIRMPVMDGLQSATIIRTMDRSDAKTIPIIATSANAYAKDIQQTHDANMNEHLSKPIDPALLYKTLAKYIKKAKQAKIKEAPSAEAKPHTS